MQCPIYAELMCSVRYRYRVNQYCVDAPRSLVLVAELQERYFPPPLVPDVALYVQPSHLHSYLNCLKPAEAVLSRVFHTYYVFELRLAEVRAALL